MFFQAFVRFFWVLWFPSTVPSSKVGHGASLNYPWMYLFVCYFCISPAINWCPDQDVPCLVPELSQDLTTMDKWYKKTTDLYFHYLLGAKVLPLTKIQASEMASQAFHVKISLHFNQGWVLANTSQYNMYHSTWITIYNAIPYTWYMRYIVIYGLLKMSKHGLNASNYMNNSAEKHNSECHSKSPFLLANYQTH